MSTEFARLRSSTLMLAKICAAWLVVLVLLPFTAPFSAFDVTELLPGQSDGIAGGRSAVPTTAIAHAGWGHAALFPPRTGRLRVVMTRQRLSSALAAPHRSPQTPVEASTIHARHPSSRPTVLRI